MSDIILKKINSKDELFNGVFALRENVLRIPLGLSLYNEDTRGDAEDAIYIALSAEKVIGCVMCKNIGDDGIKLRQMAVDESFQKCGIGKLLVLEAERDSLQNGCKKISLHARQNAVGFYEKLGYRTYGPVFTEVGIPHLAMEKLL